MHPALIVAPVLAAAFGPRLWAKWELRRFDQEDGAFLPADELARRLLDREGLTLVRVEVTDLGDHYDPLAKAVRLSRGHFHRSSLTAATTVAHEVGHALQDAAGSRAFRLHQWLARLAQVTTSVGTILLLAVPAAAIAAQTPAPSRLLSLGAAGMLGSGLAAQLAALPTELDASFGRALPLLRECCLSDAQVGDARRILLACSLTYLASAAVPVVVLWPIIGARLTSPGLLASMRTIGTRQREPSSRAQAAVVTGPSLPEQAPRAARPAPRVLPPVRAGAAARGCADARRDFSRRRARRQPWLRALARPVVRQWLLLTGGY